MDRTPIHIEEDIRRAWTLPSEVYRRPHYLEQQRERIFLRSWQFVTDTERVKVPGQLHPHLLLEGFLDQPLLLTRDAQDRVHCLSNVCTHRGNLLVEGPGHAQVLRCRYHGRRFALNGRLLSMPEFEGVEGFPSAEDNLAAVPMGLWGKFLFASLDPASPFEEVTEPVRERLAWMPLQDLVFDPATSRDYLVRANWALYVDNYLEGFHIPYVHGALSEVLDYGAYRTELFRHGSLQVGVASGSEGTFRLPPGSPDHGQEIAAYYFWLFPNLMFNFYPWGLSINVVVPLAVDRTRVSYLTYLWTEAGERPAYDVDRVEREDEAIVERVQQGLGTRLYRRGRYSPAREAGVHHFHRLMAELLA